MHEQQRAATLLKHRKQIVNICKHLTLGHSDIVYSMCVLCLWRISLPPLATAETMIGLQWPHSHGVRGQESSWKAQRVCIRIILDNARVIIIVITIITVYLYIYYSSFVFLATKDSFWVIKSCVPPQNLCTLSKMSVHQLKTGNGQRDWMQQASTAALFCAMTWIRCHPWCDHVLKQIFIKSEH